MDQEKERKTKSNQKNSRFQSIKKVIKNAGYQKGKRGKMLQTYKVEKSRKNLQTNPDLNSNDVLVGTAVYNKKHLTIVKTKERIDENHDSDSDLMEDNILFPELCSKNNAITTCYAKNAEADVNLNKSEELMDIDQYSQDTLFNSSDMPSSSIQVQAETNSYLVNSAELGANIKYDGTNFESERHLENTFLSTPNYSHREIPVKQSVVNGESIYGIICEKRSGLQWTYDEDDLDVSDQLKIYAEYLKLKVDILNFVIKASIKDEFKPDIQKSVSDCLKKQHYEKDNWLEKNPIQVWYTITSVLKKPGTPPYLFFSHIIDWLCKKKDIHKIMWIAKKLTDWEKSQTPETEHSKVWNYILKALIDLGMKQWSAISIFLHFCHENDFPQVTTRIIFSLKLEQVTNYPNYWKCFQILVELKFQLPQIILAKILESSCDRNHPIRGNDKFISDIAAQVCQIKQTDFTLMRKLVQNFLNNYEPVLPSTLKCQIRTMLSSQDITLDKQKREKSLSLNPTKTRRISQKNNNAQSESASETNVDNVLIDLQQAIESQDNLAIAKILVSKCNTPLSNKIGKKFYYLMQKKENIGTEAVNILSHIDKINSKATAKLFFAKLCIDLMFFLAHNDKWAEAYQVLELVRYMNYNPVRLKPVVHSLNGVYTAVTCSQILLNSGHFNTAIYVIINNKLLYENKVKWLVEGEKKDFVLVKNTISALFSKFLDTKMIRFSLKLFHEVINVQESLFAPINISSTFEPILKQLFMKFETFNDLAIHLFLTVYELNEEFGLDAFTNRLLIICAMRNQVYHIVHELVSIAITSHGYPKIQSKDTITLTRNLLEEEMMAYIIIWCTLFNKRIANEPQSSKANINLNIELKEARKEDLPLEYDQELPDILKSVDFSWSGALFRANTAIGKVINIQDFTAETYLNCNPIILSTVTSHKLISSACQFFGEKMMSTNKRSKSARKHS